MKMSQSMYSAAAGAVVGLLLIASFSSMPALSDASSKVPQNGRCWNADEVGLMNASLTGPNFASFFTGIMPLEQKSELCKNRPTVESIYGQYKTCEGKSVHDEVAEYMKRHAVTCASPPERTPTPVGRPTERQSAATDGQRLALASKCFKFDAGVRRSPSAFERDFMGAEPSSGSARQYVYFNSRDSESCGHRVYVHASVGVKKNGICVDTDKDDPAYTYFHRYFNSGQSEWVPRGSNCFKRVSEYRIE